MIRRELAGYRSCARAQALHTGVAELRDGDYHGGPLNRTARLMAAAAGAKACSRKRLASWSRITYRSRLACATWVNYT